MSKNKAAYETFISYRHKELDTRLAKAIHRQLETYRIPSNIAKRAGKKRMGKVFRDQDELPLLADLGEGVRRALEASEWLIVVCSPDLPESKWCMAEVDYFIELGRRDRILTVLIGGEPKESFPPQLRFEALNGETVEREPLAADVRGNSAAASLRKLRREKLRLLAPMLGVGYDDLRRRQRRRSMQMAAAVGLSVVLILSAFLAYALVQNTRLERQRNAALQSQSRFLSNISQEMNQAGDTMSALMLALEALPGDLQKPDRPLVAEAEAALRQAMQGPAGEGFVLDSGSRIENTAYMGAIPSADGRIILNINAAPYEEYNVFTGETLRRFDIVDGFFTGLFAYSPDGKYLALHSTKTISGDPRVVAERFEFYDSDRKLASFEHKGDYFTEQIRFAPGGNGEIRLTVRRTYTLEVYRCNRQSGFLEEEFHTNVLPAGEDAAYLRRVIWNPDGSRMLLSYGSKPDDWDSPVCAADGRTGKILGTVPVAEAVEWSPDGGRILCVREDGGYQLWDGEPGGVLIDLELPADVRVTDVYHRDYEYMPKFSPESGKVALLGADGICRVYRAADGAPLCSLSAAALADNLRSPDLESFSWSADGRYLACVSEFEEVFVFDAENGGLTQTPDTDGKSVSDALFIPGTNTIAVLGSDRPSIGQAGTLLSGGAENLTAGDVFRAIPRIAGMILNAEDWEDKHLLFRIWRMSGGQEYIPAAAILGVGNGKNAGDAGITEDNGGADAGDAGILMANRVNWTADGTFIRVDIGTPLTAALLTGKQNPRDYFARQALVNPDAPAPPASLPEGAFALEYSPSGLRALTVWPAEDYVRMIFDAESGQSAPLGIPDHWDDGFKYANTAAFAPDERKLRYGAGVFDAVTGALLYEFAEGSVSDPSAQSAIKAKDFFIWSPDGARFALRSLSGAEETAGVRDAVTGEKRFALPGGGSNSPDGPNNPVSNIVFSPDGTQIAYSDTSLRLADAGTGEIRFTLPADDGPVLSAAFSPDGGRIAYSGASIRLADTGTGKLVAETRESGAAGGELAWSPDGHILAAHDSYGRTAIFYDGALNPLFTLENQDTAPGFSFDSHFVLTGNGTVYSTENGKPLLTNTSLSAAFSPAGPRYALLLADGSVQIRELPPLSELMTRARLRLNGRVFTAKERAEYFLE